MSIIKHALVAASLAIATTGAQAQVTTYIGGPKSHLTQTVRSGGANAYGFDEAARSYARATPVRTRASAPQAGLSGGANAIGVDESVPVRPRAYRAVPARSNAGLSRGANAIGVDEAN